MASIWFQASGRKNKEDTANCKVRRLVSGNLMEVHWLQILKGRFEAGTAVSLNVVLHKIKSQNLMRNIT